MSFTSHLGVFSLVGAHRSTTGLRTMGPGITYSWSIFPGIKEEWNESSGRRRGGHFGGRKGKGREETGAAKKNGEREKEREKERRRKSGWRGRRRGRRRARAPHHGGKHSGYRDCAAATLSIIHLAPGPMYADHYPIPEAGATGNSCSHANSPVRGRSATCCLLFLSLSFFLYAASRFHFSFLVFFTFFFFFLFPFWKRRRGKRKARLVTNKA